MTNDCKTCPVSTGTHKPAEAVHQIAEPDAQHLQELAAYRFTVDNLRARVAELEARLEIDYRHPYDGIAARDATIKAQDERIAELESQLEAIGAGGVEPLRKQAAPQAVQAAVPLPLLVRDIARDLGITVPQACIALKPLGNYSTNSAVTAEMARMLRDHFPAPAHPAEGVSAPEAVAVADERAAFEVWAKSENMNISSDCDGYIHADTAVASMAWQARAALAATQPAAQEMAHKEPSFYAAFGESGIALPQYSAHTEDGVIYNVLAVARNEGFNGSGIDRLMELGWIVSPVFREVKITAKANQEGQENG